jgi:hypothetical protein
MMRNYTTCRLDANHLAVVVTPGRRLRLWLSKDGNQLEMSTPIIGELLHLSLSGGSRRWQRRPQDKIKLVPELSWWMPIRDC